MSYCIGIDLRASAYKLQLVDESGTVRNVADREYPRLSPMERIARYEDQYLVLKKDFQS